MEEAVFWMDTFKKCRKSSDRWGGRMAETLILSLTAPEGLSYLGLGGFDLRNYCEDVSIMEVWLDCPGNGVL